MCKITTSIMKDALNVIMVSFYNLHLDGVVDARIRYIIKIHEPDTVESQDNMLYFETQVLDNLFLKVDNLSVCFNGYTQTLRCYIRIVMLDRKDVIR